MSRTRKPLLLLIVAAAALGCYLWLRPRGTGEDLLAARGTTAGTAREGTGEQTGEQTADTRSGLFAHGNPYLDGRSAWFAERFRRSRAALAADRDLPASPTFECRVRRNPFTEGPWVGALDEELARQRAETERQTVEIAVAAFFPGVEPRHLLLYLAASEFLERVRGEGTLEEETFLVGPKTGPDGLASPPRLLENEWITRRHWTRSFALPTAVDSVNAAFRDADADGALVIVDEAWANFGDERYAGVRLDSGQHAIVGRSGGSLLLLEGFYSGQTIPRFTDAIASSMTVAYYRKVVRLIDEEVRSWNPPPEVEARFRAMGIGPP